MNRRGFLAMLAGLPFVGKLFPGRKVPDPNASYQPLEEWLRENPARCPFCGGQLERMTGWCPKCDRVPEEEADERRFRQIRKQRVTMTCVCCDRSIVVTLPAEMVLTGMLKTGKHVCNSCSNNWRDNTWHSRR